MSINTGLEIFIHCNDGTVSRFEQVNTRESREIMDNLRPDRIFAQHNLVVKSGTSLTVFPCNSVARVDFIMDGHPDWPHHHNVEMATEICAAEFFGELERAQSAMDRGDRVAGAFAADAFAEISLANSDRVFAKYLLQAQEITAADSGVNMQHLFDAPSQYLRRRGGGAILLNSANVVRLRVYPGPPDIPTAWHADVLDAGRSQTSGRQGAELHEGTGYAMSAGA